MTCTIPTGITAEGGQRTTDLPRTAVRRIVRCVPVQFLYSHTPYAATDHECIAEQQGKHTRIYNSSLKKRGRALARGRNA